jgi:hypothetical protein
MSGGAIHTCVCAKCRIGALLPSKSENTESMIAGGIAQSPASSAITAFGPELPPVERNWLVNYGQPGVGKGGQNIGCPAGAD